MTRKIEVVDHNPEWHHQFEKAMREVASILRSEVVSIHHIGSTSIQDLAAKPIIDILVIVHNIEKVDKLNQKMAAEGYFSRGEYGIPGRRFFVKGSDENRTHHIHIFQSSHPAIANHLDFRDYIRFHPKKAQEYGDLKKELAQEFPNDIDKYMAGKDSLIKSFIKEARAWRH